MSQVRLSALIILSIEIESHILYDVLTVYLILKYYFIDMIIETFADLKARNKSFQNCIGLILFRF